MTLADLEKRIQAIEDIEEIKKLHQNYINLMDNLEYEHVLDLFTDDATVEVRQSVQSPAACIWKSGMKALFLTNEYPPYTYGGAGVHVDYLTRELAKMMSVEVRCFGDQRWEKGNLKVTGFALDTSDFTCPKPLQSVFGAVRRCTDFNTAGIDADVVHCHTWYSHFGGILAKLNYGRPLVITVHSLEPLRPWKREQLGGGYDFSLWLERTALEMADAVIAVSPRNQGGHRAPVSGAAGTSARDL
jgi:glycosyltransferase involved in cell wall biosynthesis